MRSVTGARARRVLLFFIDGVGVGEDDPDRNPLATGEFPTLRLTRSQALVEEARIKRLPRGEKDKLAAESRDR